MIYKLEYKLEDDPKPHQRWYNALTPDTATAMFEATCADGTLTGYQNITLLSVEALSSSHEDKETPPLSECVG